MSRIFLLAFCLVSTYPAQGVTPSDNTKWQQLLKELVETNSGTDNLAGQEAVRQKLIPVFKELGYEAHIQDLVNGRKLLIFDYPNSTPTILFVGHIDTVFSKASAFQQFKDDGSLIHGPGIADMKGGVIMMAQVLSDLQSPELRSKIRIVLNDDEETGSADSRSAMQKLAQEIPYILIFEPAVEGKITIGHPGGIWFNLTTTGKAAHAGESHKLGVNACVELSHKIIELAKLTDYKKGVTVNPGVIEGGTKANVVCDHASVMIDVRFRGNADRDVMVKKIERIAKHSYIFNKEINAGTTSTLQVKIEMGPMAPEFTKELSERFFAVTRPLNIKLEGHYKGGIDSYGLALPGKKLLSGLGPAGYGYHTDQEYINPGLTEEKRKANVAFVRDLLKQ